jgi:hypothetical protein
MTKPRNDPALTAERVRQILEYDPESGEFRWREKIARKVIVRKIAGASSKRGDVRIAINLKDYLAHRLAWLHFHGRWPANEIDHINGNPADNRICNLREATHAENGQNLARSRSNTSGHTGVSWHSQRGKWQARIRGDGRYLHLGLFESKDEAAAAYQQAKAKFHKFQPYTRLP